MVLTSHSKQTNNILPPVCENGGTGIVRTVVHLWVSGYSCLLKVPKKSYRAAGNGEQVSQNHVQQPQALQLYYYWQPRFRNRNAMHCALCVLLGLPSLPGRAIENFQVRPAPCMVGFSALLSLADYYSKRLLVPFDTTTSAAIYEEKGVWIFQLALRSVPHTQLGFFMWERGERAM